MSAIRNGTRNEVLVLFLPFVVRAPQTLFYTHEFVKMLAVCIFWYRMWCRSACSAPSSSDAPVCGSLVRAASAKSSLLLPARVTDNHQRSRLWTGARCPRTQRLYRRASAGSAATPPTHVASLSRPTSQDAR